jgi:uroporphyrinogen-III synthase
VSNAIQIERGILSGFGGGCHIPIGAHATPTENGFRIRATFSKEWESFSKRVRFEASNLEEGLNTFKRLKETALPSSIFISKDIRPDSYLSRACAEHKLHLTGQSLIQISHLPFQAHAKDCDWVFFSSSNSVEAFFSQEKPSDWASKKFATAGEATANALGNYISSIDFIGSESDMGTVSREFKAIIGEDKVLFPISDRSLRSIQTELDDGQSINIVCYSTKPVVSKIDIAQAYILTSPSNVEVFLEGNDGFPENAKLISIGKSTAKKLNEHGLRSLIAEIPHESELWALLAS